LPNGTVDCWGIEAPDGVLGDNGATNGAAYYPQPVPGLSGVTSLAVGAEHACALVAGGVVECWGAQGSVGLGALPAAVPTPITSLETEDGGGPMLGVAAGDNESCALATDRETLWCWGQYDSTSGTVDVPTYVAKLGARVVELSAGYAVTCALTNDGSVWCWGQNNNGALGRSDVAPGATMLTPLQVPLGGPAEHLCVGRWHGCVVTPSHSIVCWGDDSEGQLAVAPFDDGGLAPMTIPIGQGHVLKVGCGAEHTCALFDDGGVSCWGYDYYEQLGSSVPDNGSLTPVPVPGLGPAVDLFVNDDTGCATLADGGLACWGYDAFGQLGAGPGPADGGGEPIGAYPITL